LRYLEQFRFGLVREALRERNLMVETICPYLTEPTRFLYPLRHRLWERLYVGAGVLLYDLLAAMGKSTLPWHRHHSRRATRRLAPGLREDALIGAVSYSDVVVDDARHTVVLARTAAAAGAAMVSSARAVGLHPGNGSGHRVVIDDLETGERIEVESHAVLNTTGVWTDQIEAWSGDRRSHVRASKGIHLVIPREAIDLKIGLILRTEVSVLFIVPWDRYWIVGTTDTPWNLHKAHPAASRTDIEYLLGHVNTVLRRPLGDEDIVGVYAGLRPLLVGESEVTSRLSREHAVRRVVPGLISVAGGKYTTYRVMARDAIDAVAAELPGQIPPSRTESIPLVGVSEQSMPTPSNIPEANFRRLLKRYGDRVSDLDEMIELDPALGHFVTGAEPYLRAEVLYGVTHEGALHLDDILTRRTRISIETGHRGTESAQDVARIMATALDWDETTIAREIEHYLARVRAERDSQTQPDDTTADAARMGAPDVRMGADRSSSG
jgi:glycerol-3-phosphate dehydrogenase